MVAAVLLPVVLGVVIPLIPFRTRKQRMWYVESIVLVTSILVWAILCSRPDGTFVLFRFTGNLSISFRLDGLGTVFAGILSTLWPLAALYAFEYMEHEKGERFFFMFYVITYGITL